MVIQISVLHRINRCLIPHQHFVQCICSVEQISPCLSCTVLLPKCPRLLPSHQDRLWEDLAVSVHETSIHAEGRGRSLALLLSQPGEIKDFTGLCKTT